ncbi:MAG: TonB-dependent receptor plug domain-containing protein [Crocinitomix sp.]|nr:TonB-dependent receptor plug domain-containing protein [Crocinitomix sp.]
MKKLNLIFVLIFIQTFSFGQDLTQTIRGIVTDKQSQFPIPGAKIFIQNSDPLIGAITDFDGSFEIKNAPIGRLTLEIKFSGYETATVPNQELKSGKELVINIGLEESIELLDKVEVTFKEDKKEAINKMATVSARTISTEEAGKFAGTLNDPARMAQNYAGVSGVSDDRNDIIIRGNSPLGVLWRMDGIDIPSPNHFSTLGTTGGPISMLNINNLSNSDFFTSAWSADYGNALSGVFDLRLRNGNNAKREYLAQVGFNGFEFGAEGPFSKKSRASYLINYRYSTLGVMSALGIDLGVGTAVPQYQDLTFKMNFPTKKAGKFTLWGIGGVSYIEFAAPGELDSTNLYSDPNEQTAFRSRTGVIGASHKYFFNQNTFSELILAGSITNTIGQGDTLSSDGDAFNVFGFDRAQRKLSANYKINHKINAKNTFAIGAIAEHYATNIKDSAYVYGDYRIIAKNNGNALLLQSYINYQHKFSEKLLFNGGLHTQHFLLTESHAVEPRVGFKYSPNARHTFSVGSGLHSQIQPITVYFIEDESTDQTTFPNQNLGFTKAVHNVLGYDLQISENMRLKAEVYYQYLYEVPVDSFASNFTMLNQGAGFELPNGTAYQNSGTGTNYGLELTLERFFNQGYYFLFTTSLFDSKYTGSNNIERNTAFNGNYIFNLLAGKEFNLKRNLTLSFDLKTTYAGGRRYTPIDLVSSQMANTEILFEDQLFEAQHQNYFRFDFKTTLKHNGKRVNQEFSADLQNLTNQQNIFQQGYNANTGTIGTVYQRGFFPNVQYRINF